MESALYIGLSRQVALKREIDVISNNIANANTTGFKAERFVFEEYLSTKDNPVGRSAAGMSFVEDRSTWHDLAPGPAVTTGNPLDVAIDGDGFFAVQTPEGERYTRNGAFSINPRGELVTSEGYQVLGNGGPITFTAEDADATIGRDGTIATRDGVRGRLRVVRFDQPQSLDKVGGGLFQATTQPIETTGGEVRLVQGALEKSNVKSVVEITRLMDVTRTYTQLSTLMGRTDELRRSAIERLADVPA